MFFLVLVNTISVIYFFIREVKSKFIKLQIKKEKMTKIGILIICYQFLVLVFLLKFNHKITYFILSILPIFLLNFVNKFIIKNNERRFRSEFYHYLKGVSLSMRVGHSFRFSLKDSRYLLSEAYRSRVDVIIESVVFTQHKKLDLHSAFEAEIQREFNKIDASTHQSLKRLSLWMEGIEKKSDFRHKSVQVLHQLYIQAGILSLMYFALLFFVYLNYGLFENIKIILASLFLFILGLTLCFKIGKKIKWNF